MKKSYLIPLSVLFIVAFSSFKKIADWISYTSAEGKYKVMMPSAPVEQSQKIPSALGELTMYMAMLESSDESDANLLYMTAYSEYPADKISSDLSKDMIDKFFKGAAEGSAKKMDGSIESMTESSYKNYPARNVITKVKLSGMEFLAIQRLILVKNKFYMLQTFTHPDKGENENSKKFFDSFSLQE